MRVNKSSIFKRIAGHFATLLGHEPYAAIDIAQLLVLGADVPFVGNDHTNKIKRKTIRPPTVHHAWQWPKHTVVE
jgi:hypothetical protein